MVRKVFFLLAMMIVQSAGGSVQGHGLGVVAGSAYHETRDLLISPMIYSGFRWLVGVHYGYTGAVFEHELDGMYSLGNTRSSAANQNEETGILLSYRFLFSMFHLEQSHFRMHAGIQFETLFNDRLSVITTDNETVTDVYKDAYSYEMIFSLAPLFQFGFPIKSGLILKMQSIFPIFAFVARPGYALGPSGNQNTMPESGDFLDRLGGGRFETVPEHLHWIGRVVLGLERKNGFWFEFVYRFMIYSIDSPQNMGTAVNQLEFRIVKRLGR